MTALTRREILAAFLGAPFLAACTPPPRARETPDGDLLGAGMTLGHRLRDQPPPEVPDEKLERVPVVIAGGGAAGLAAAWRLARAGVRDFVLLELEPVPGGTARSGTSPVVAYPWGAHYIAAPSAHDTALVALLDELSVLEGKDELGEPVVKEQFLCRDPEERVFHRGTWYEGLYLHEGATARDLEQVERFRREIAAWVDWRDGRDRRAFAIPCALASDDAHVKELDRLSFAEWLRARGFDSERLLWLVDYACRDDYGTRPDRTSAWAGLFYFSARMPDPARDTRPLVTWPEGNGRLVAHLFERVRDRVRLGTAVADVAPVERDGRPLVRVVTVDASGQARGFLADRVIFSAPQHVARRVVRPWRDDPPAHCRAFEHGSWWVANLHLSDRPREDGGFPLSWDNVLRESPSLGYVVATHQRLLDHGPTVFTYYHPLPDGDATATRRSLFAADRADLVEVALADLERAHPDVRDLVERADVLKWGHAMVRPSPGFLWGGLREQARRPFRGIHFAHAELSGIALFEEALDHGVRAAEEVLAARGVAFARLRGGA